MMHIYDHRPQAWAQVSEAAETARIKGAAETAGIKGC